MHVSVILQENYYSTRTAVRGKIPCGFLHEIRKSYSTVESPLALYSAKTWVGILSGPHCRETIVTPRVDFTFRTEPKFGRCVVPFT